MTIKKTILKAPSSHRLQFGERLSFKKGSLQKAYPTAKRASVVSYRIGMPLNNVSDIAELESIILEKLFVRSNGLNFFARVFQDGEVLTLTLSDTMRTESTIAFM